jgi:hypothetical protein
MMTVAVLVIKVEAFHQICLQSVGLDTNCENLGTECSILVYYLYSLGTLFPTLLCKSKVKVKMSLTMPRRHLSEVEV